jgi:hypothetical protein
MSQVVIPSTNGVLYFYGPRPARDENILGLIHKSGDTQEMEFYYDFSTLPAPATATSPGFIAGSGIPAYSLIRYAYVEVLTAFAGGTSYIIGLQTVAGVEIDNNGLFTNLLLASIGTIGDRAWGDGALFNPIPVQITLEGFPYSAATGTFTAGVMRLIIGFDPPSTAPSE